MQIECTHCGLSFDKKVMIKDGEHHFCCKGCQGVYELLYSQNLDSFYAKRGGNKLEPVVRNVQSLERFDSEGFVKKYVKQKGGLNEVNLVLEHIHCAACVWLNEKILHKTNGVVSVEINYSNNKAKIIWNPEVIKLSQIIEKIQTIGYDANAYDPKLQENKATKTRQEYYAKLLVALFASMNIMWIAVAKYVGYFSGMNEDIKFIMDIAEFALATPALFVTGWVYFRGSYFALKNRYVNMDLLIATGSTLTYLYSIYAMVSRSGETYFDSVVMIITFVFVGKYLEVLGKKKASDTLDTLISQTPTEVTLVGHSLKPKAKSQKLVNVDEVCVGDLLELKAGGRVVIDGVVSIGSGLFDESSITGEANPVYKQEGDEIFSGSVCLDSVVVYEATKEAKDSLLSNIINLLEDSLSKKPHIQQLADKISGYFAVIILTIALATFLGWYFYNGGFENAFIISIAVIIIACPCALGLATPISTLVGVSKLAKLGILFKSSSYLETMAQATVFAFDKTGTITNGKPEVIKFKKLKQFDENLLYSLVSSSTHPISQTIKNYLQNENSKNYHLEDVKNIEGLGLGAKFEDINILGGSSKLLKKFDIEFGTSIENTQFIFVVNGEVVCYFELKDELKEDAVQTIKELNQSGIKTIMLTGDNETTAKNIAKSVGINKYKASLFPQDKQKIIKKLQENGEIVVMVGDGVNDALSLSSANVSIAFSSGADISTNISDIVILNDDISSVLTSYKTSKKTYHIIKQNLTSSLIYNALTIPLAIAGYIIPLFAALSMSLSSLLVVLNSFRIQKS